MSHWEYNMVCCGAYAKADYSKPNLYVIDNKQNEVPANMVGVTPLDYIQDMGTKGWQLICQIPAASTSGSTVPNQILFSFKRAVDDKPV